MTQREKLIRQGINPDRLVPVSTDGPRRVDVCSDGPMRKTSGAFRKREQFRITKWSWAR